ncbi:MAG: N-acetyltransferase [Xanthobacteraceae bacterium]
MTVIWKSITALPSDAAPFAIRAERASDVRAREALLDASFGEGRHARTCQRLRDGRVPAEGLAFTAEHDGRVVGTVRLWHVSAAGVPALVLGPLAIDASCRKLGLGAALMRQALNEAAARGHGAVILRGDPDYYARFGFSAAKTGDLALPGPFERERLLAVELRSGALDEASGMIVATGAKARRPRARHRKMPVAATTQAA